MNAQVLPHHARARVVWNSAGGLYEDISRTIADAIEHAVERLEPAPGERILDLATGTGWASRLVAQRSRASVVTGVDIADRMLEAARALAAAAALPIDYHVADAEALPFEAGAFDGVISTFGVMFTSKPDVAARELARVVRPGGRLVLATWTPDGNVAAMFGVMRPFLAVPPSVSPFAWGARTRIEELLGSDFDLRFENGTNHFRYGSGAQAYRLWVNHYGPARSLAASLDDAALARFERSMVAWHESFPSPLGYDQPRTYLITSAIRRTQ
jgi:SAM-dependent methyltransferase